MSVAAAEETAFRASSDSVTFAFGDPAAKLYGLARLGVSDAGGSALAILFSGQEPVAAVAQGGLEVGEGASWASLALDRLRATVNVPLDRWTVALDGDEGFALEFAAVGAAAAAPALGGMAGYEQPCRVRGTVRVGGVEHAIEALGARSRAFGDPDWEQIELTRTVAAWTDGAAATLTAIRPAGARHHGDEATWAAVWEPEGLLAIDDGRLSTTYDADGHTRRAGLELWPGDEEAWARRGAGEVLCGSSLDLGSLQLDCAFFRWHFEGRAGVGRYDIVRRTT